MDVRVNIADDPSMPDTKFDPVSQSFAGTCIELATRWALPCISSVMYINVRIVVKFENFNTHEVTSCI